MHFLTTGVEKSMDLMKKIFNVFTKKEKGDFVFLLVYMIIGGIFEAVGIGAIFPPVSYTHLDVYKRQVYRRNNRISFETDLSKF